MQLLFQQQRTGAERDIFLPLDEPGDDLVDLAMDQRLATRNGDHWRAAFLGRRPALFGAEPAIQDRIRVIDLAAAGTGQVAAEKRLEHQHERVTLVPLQFLARNIGPDRELLTEWNAHHFSFRAPGCHFFGSPVTLTAPKRQAKPAFRANSAP